jgi:hypothetical protein
MEQKKLLLFVIIPIIVAIIIIVLVFLGVKSKKAGQNSAQQPTGAPAQLPESTEAAGGSANQSPTGQGNATGTGAVISGPATSKNGRLEISTPSGQIAVNDFYKGAEITSSGVVYFADKETYNIAYNSTGNEFIVTLLVNKNIESVRKEAEAELLAKLGASRDDACKLKVYLYVSAAVSASLSQNHGLSFCPESQSFPN